MAIKSSQQLGLSGVDNTLLKTQGRRAVGGTVTESGGYVIHTFTGSGQFTVLDQKLNLEYLIVGDSKWRCWCRYVSWNITKHNGWYHQW